MADPSGNRRGGRPPATDPESGTASDGAETMTPTTAARSLLEAVKRGEATAPYERRLADLDATDLGRVRRERRAGLAFWLNVYNAAAQLLLARRPALYDSRWRFFRAEAITVAGTGLSLDDIEHGLLRNRKSKYGFGYLPRLVRTGLAAEFRLAVDPRVHFALNCGAASCPAVLAYDPETVDRTLDAATETHLEQTVQSDNPADTVRVPRFCLWFLGDFGGFSGLRSFLREFDVIPPNASPRIRFNEYDWGKAPRKFGDGR